MAAVALPEYAITRISIDQDGRGAGGYNYL